MTHNTVGVGMTQI